MADFVFKIGQTVETSAHQRGLVKYIGSLHVADGNWLGIELPTADGKNDGSVRGERYFSCPPAHGLFVKDTSVQSIIAQPPQKASSKVAVKPPAATSSSSKVSSSTKPRPSSVVAPKPNPRLSTINKRQSVAPTSTHTSLRAPIRKTSNAGTSVSSAVAPSSTTSTSKASRDSNVDTLQTKLRHAERQHIDDQEKLLELGQVREERDRFKSIIEKLQTKCQKLLQTENEQATQLQQLRAENDQLSRTVQEHEVDLEEALIDKEMAEERAEVAEVELNTLRAKIEERDMELEILREEAELFTTEMTPEEQEEAGYYRLQHENDRLRAALVTLKEMTSEEEQNLKVRVRELEVELSGLEKVQQVALGAQEQLTAAHEINQHLRAEIDANAEWEDVSEELTAKCHRLEDTVAAQEAAIQDLESLRELNDELETQHAEQEEDLRNELDAKDIELAEQHARITTQDATIEDQDNLITKFRELVFELQDKMNDAESSRNMTELQAQDATGRFNEVMDLNRRLRTSTVQATEKTIVSELRRLRADEAEEMLDISTQASSADFAKSETILAYFSAKRVAGKATLLSNLLHTFDRQRSHNGGLDEAMSRLFCARAVQRLTTIRAGSERLSSAISTSNLAQFAGFGSTHNEFNTIERVVDSGLNALRTDKVDLGDLAASLDRASDTCEAVIHGHQQALKALPEDIILARVQNIASGLEYLDANFAVVNTMLAIIPNSDNQRVMEYFAPPSALCNKTMLSAQRLLRTTVGLRNDGLYPLFLGGHEKVIEVEAHITDLAHQAAQLGEKAVRIVSTHVDGHGTFDETAFSGDLHQLLEFYWSSELYRLSVMAPHLDDWTDEISVLQNSSEIVHGPTPWAQMAHEVDIERQKNTEAVAELEILRAVHNATLLAMHEREREIDTKSLVIEHLEAKYKDAITRTDDYQQLLTRYKYVQEDADRLLRLSNAQSQQIAILEASSSETTSLPPATDAPIGQSPIQPPVLSTRIPASVTCMLGALESENHWLRHRENSVLFDRSLREVFVHMQIARRAEQFLAGQMSVAEYYESTAIEVDFSDDEDDVNDTAETDRVERELSPVALDKVQTGWRPRANEPGWDVLSVVEEDFEGDTMGLEGFSEIQDMMEFEGFREIRV